MANPNPPLDQPDPWDPDRATCEAVQELTERLTRRLTDRESGESFTECLACGEVDSHHESCIVPVLESWLEGSESSECRTLPAAPDLLRENTELRASLTEAQAEIERLKREVSRLDGQCFGFEMVITKLRQKLHSDGVQ